jgi:signal transduction histidine kinase
MATLIDDLLDMTRLRAGRLKISRQECDVGLLVAEAVIQMKAEAANSGSVIRLHHNGPVEANLDPLRIGQVLTNLLSNAIKYGKGNPIDVRVSREGGRTAVSVQDYGFGIPMEQHERIFEAFERLEATTAIRGVGLGLYIAREIVHAHNGTIGVVSSLGAGSTFTVRL